MSLVSLSAVSSIQKTGKSITMAKIASSDDLDAGAELAPAADGRRRGLAGDSLVGQAGGLDVSCHR